MSQNCHAFGRHIASDGQRKVRALDAAVTPLRGSIGSDNSLVAAKLRQFEPFRLSCRLGRLRHQEADQNLRAVRARYLREHSARSEGYFRLEWKLAADRSHLMAAEPTTELRRATP